MRFHGVFLGNQHEIRSKQHNGKVRKVWEMMSMVARTKQEKEVHVKHLLDQTPP